jgi:enolase-phosphatase E1
LAQQNLFKYTNHGDLTPFISYHFDTKIGGKREPASYAAIAGRLATAPKDIVFVSDIPEELDAAIATGMRAMLSARPGNGRVENAHKYTSIERLTEIEI